MRIRIIQKRQTVYQEPWPGETEPSSMDSVVITAELLSDDGEKQMTIGRLFFSPEDHASFGDEMTLESEGVTVQ